MTPVSPPADALSTLRSYRTLAPWGLADLAALAGAILSTSGVVPLSAAAQARPSPRTVRFYLTRHLMDGPEGRGTAAVYGYRHLLQLLSIKLRQMEGATLEAIEAEARDQTGDAIERRVAATLGEALPPPDLLGWVPGGRGRSGRAAAGALPPAGPGGDGSPVNCRRIPVTRGIELLVDLSHPALRLPEGDAALAARVREVLEGAGPLPAD